MDKKLLRDYCIELVGTFFFVLTGAGAMCANYVALPEGQSQGTSPLTLHQPGVVGVALALGLAWAVLIALTAPITGCCLNPAVTIMLWLFHRIPSIRASWLLGAQLLGSVLAGACVWSTYQPNICQLAHFGAPHVNPLAYPDWARHGIPWAGALIEFILTFLLVFAMFGGKEAHGVGSHGAWLGGAVVAIGVLVAYPLTGAALNPARWLGPTLWEYWKGSGRPPFADAFVYIAGPIVGAIAGGWWSFKVVAPGK